MLIKTLNVQYLEMVDVGHSQSQSTSTVSMISVDFDTHATYNLSSVTFTNKIGQERR